MSVKYKLSDIWRNVTKGYTKVAGSWSKADIVYIKENGSWRIAAKRVPNVTGTAYDTAQTTLTALGFSVSKSNTNSSDTTYNGYSGGFVQSQVPGIDELASMGDTITLNTITYSPSAPSFGPYFFNPGFAVTPTVTPSVTPTVEPSVTPTVTPTPPPSFYPGFYVPYGTGLIGYAYVSPPPPYEAPSFFYNPYGGGGYGMTCVLGNTKIHTTKGLVEASNLSIGDNLLSLNVEEIDPSEEKVNVYYWLSGTFTIKELTTTAVTRITKSEVTDLVVINGESYTFDHIILVERNGEYEFIKAQFAKETDKVLVLKQFAGPVTEFVQIQDITREHHKDGVTVYDIGVEPYDIYFTEAMLSHNK